MEAYCHAAGIWVPEQAGTAHVLAPRVSAGDSLRVTAEISVMLEPDPSGITVSPNRCNWLRGFSVTGKLSLCEASPFSSFAGFRAVVCPVLQASAGRPHVDCPNGSPGHTQFLTDHSAVYGPSGPRDP